MFSKQNSMGTWRNEPSAWVRKSASYLIKKGMEEKAALATARKIAEVFGKIEDEKADHPSYIRQLAFISPKEREAAFALAQTRRYPAKRSTRIQKLFWRRSTLLRTSRCSAGCLPIIQILTAKLQCRWHMPSQPTASPSRMTFTLQLTI